MSLTVLVRDALDAWPDTLSPSRGERGEFVWARLERLVQAVFQYVFLGGWLRQLVELPVVVPQLTQARTWILPPGGNLHLPLTEWANPTGPAFQQGLQNAFFLGLPLTLSHLLRFKRYALQGLPRGVTARASYRFGEVLLLCTRGRGLGASLTQWEPLPLLLGLLLTAAVVYEAVSLPGGGPRTSWLYIAGLHFTYAFVEQGVLLSSLGSQTLDTAAQAARWYVGPGSFLSSVSYGLGLYLGGLRIDSLFLAGGRALVERLFLWFRRPPESWRRAVDQGATRLIVALAVATLPFYTADYVSRNLFGFSSRDTELAKALSRIAFSVKRPQPGEPVSVQFEGRNVLSPESYGRTAPDVVRDPWHRATLGVEAQREGIDETFATRTSNQRVDAVYLGSLERGVYEWLNRRGTSSPERRGSARDTVPVAAPVRWSLGREVAPSADALSRTRGRGETDRRVSRRERWYRASRSRRADSYSVNLPLERTQGHPEGLTALYHTGLEAPRYLAGGGRAEAFRAIRYDSPTEFSRKRNARRSPLHHAPVHLYRDALLSRQPRETLTSAVQQRGLYRARLALGDYLAACRRYHEAERGARGWAVNRRVSLRGVWQRELAARRSGGVRSRANTVYSQQYTGNLHLVRRLFAVSWDRRENRVAQGVRRKLSLDQLTLQRRSSAREHEELGRASVLQVQNGRQRLLAPVDASARTAVATGAPRGQWVLLPGGIPRPETQIQPQPLYAGWDGSRRALILSNRYLPPERSVRAGPTVGVAAEGPWSPRRGAETALQTSLKGGTAARTRFAVWPRNPRVRRTRRVNTRYSSRPVLQRRRPVREVQLLSRDRATWARGAVGTPSLSQFSFWLNPRSDSRRSPVDLTPTRSAQSFPVSFERSAKVGVYVPGDLQPSARGGLLWPGGDRASWFSGPRWRPGAPVLPNLFLLLFPFPMQEALFLNVAFLGLRLGAILRWLRPAVFATSPGLGEESPLWSRADQTLGAVTSGFLAGALLLRGRNTAHFPVSNLFESLVFLSFLLSGGLVLLQRQQAPPLLLAVLGLCPVLVLGFASFSLPETLREAGPLVPALKSHWLTRHVTVRIVSYAGLRLGSLVALVYSAFVWAAPEQTGWLERLDERSYRCIGFGFPFLTLGIISGAVWADLTWGSYWSWDPKETASLILWLLYAAYLHLRLLKGARGSIPAAVASFGFVGIWVCYLGVNLLGKGLHSYGFFSLEVRRLTLSLGVARLA